MKNTENEKYLFHDLPGKELEQTEGGVTVFGNKYFDALIRLISSFTNGII